MFEIALVLGGTVSAGAYTAGVLDFLIQALDEWNTAKQANPQNTPDHRVLLRVIAGTSGGGANAILCSRALSWSFGPAIAGSAANVFANNPFYNSWVQSLDIKNLLGTGDITTDAAPIPSLLNATSLENTVSRWLTSKGSAPPTRDFLQTPLPVFITYTNVGGIAYKQDFSGVTGRSEYFVDHADYIRYAVKIDGPAGGSVPANPYSLWPDFLGIGNGPALVPWTQMTQYTLGTDAFPIAFPARLIVRPQEHYWYRYANIDTGGGLSLQWMRPDWNYVVPAVTNPPTSPLYNFFSLDGGCCDNEPIELARAWLEGVNPTDPLPPAANVNRAIVLVDPFTDTPAASPDSASLLSMIFPFISSVVSANRYETADFDLFSRPDCYSRFLITAVRSKPGDTNSPRAVVTGSQAITASPLMAFCAFLSEAFRHHDFMLGRRNCQQFLRNYFTLAANNAVFNVVKPPPVLAPAPNAGELPIIPLFGIANVDEPEPPWPLNAFNPDDIQDQVTARVETLLKSLEATYVDSSLFRFVLKLADGAVAKDIASDVVNAIKAALIEAGLLSNAPASSSTSGDGNGTAAGAN